VSIKKGLKSYLAEEREASRGYQKLSKKLVKEGLKGNAKTVRGIAKDERDHFKKLTKIRKGA
jgi:rubrerythrin